MAEGILALSFALALILVAVYFWIDGNAIREETGLPDGDIIYTDNNDWHKQVETLTAPEIGLVGKPDYLIQQRDGSIVPVELKSREAPNTPYASHVMQLAAYCLLVEENYGIRPNFGIIRYKDQDFQVDYTEELEEDLLDVLHEMQQDMFAEDVNRSHGNAKLCVACGVRDFCDQRLK